MLAGLCGDPAPSTSSGQVLARLLPASGSLGSGNRDLTGFLGERLCAARDEGVFQRRLGSERSLPSRYLLIALAPSFWEEHEVPLSVYPDSPRPLAPVTPLQTANTYGHKPQHLSEKHIVLFPGPEALEGPRPRLRLFGQDVAGQCSIGGCSASFGSSATRTSLPGLSESPLFMFTLEAELTFRIFPADEVHLI